MYRALKFVLLRTAEKMPEENYAFKPAEGVRSFGQILGHVADSQYRFCSEVLVEQPPAPGIEKTRTSKADLTAGAQRLLRRLLRQGLRLRRPTRPQEKW